MNEVPEVFDVFEKKLAQVLSFTLVTHPNSTKKAAEELLTYFSSVVERASKAESRIAELEAAQRWIPVGWDALKVALFWMNVEKTEYCWIWTGSKNSCGYGTLHGARAHQISYKMFHGDLPEGLEIMHTCNNPACVNPGHLLAGTHQENMRSMFKLRRYSRCGKSSKYIGVSFRSDSHKWRAVLNKKSLGNYESEDDAAKAYDKAALVHYGKDAALNFPLPQPPEAQE